MQLKSTSILGPGLLESVYQSCMLEELRSNNLSTRSEVHVQIIYKELELPGALKLDLVINGLIIVELKSVEVIIPVYKAQLLSYLKLSGIPKGLLINFNCTKITSQLVPLVTDVFAQLPE